MSQTAEMDDPGKPARTIHADLSWVSSTGGPLIVVPATALHLWAGSTEDGVIAGSGATVDDYDRACDVQGLAAVIGVGSDRSVLVLADEPAQTCYMTDQKIFLRWLAADSEVELVEAGRVVLDDPATGWEDCGIWETDGSAVLMDSAEAGANLSVEYANGAGLPEQAPILVPAGRWSVRAFHRTSDFPWVGIVQLLPAR